MSIIYSTSVKILVYLKFVLATLWIVEETYLKKLYEISFIIIIQYYLLIIKCALKGLNSAN